jgi:NAD(P)-dependent dehydrogenase (short-subunit alcohol dehydrogenase family)
MSSGSEAATTMRFSAASTTDEVLEGVDLSGKTVLVTGVSAGLGIETARALVARGAHVIGTARDLGKASRATGEVCPPGTPGSFELVECDLASLASVRKCAEAVAAKTKRLDAIIANAGVMVCPEGKTADGFETQFGTNHLGHFVLVNRLVPLLGPGSRVVSLSSSGHRYSPVSLDDPGFEREPYDPVVAYGRAKTANSLFAVEFDRRHKAAGIRATAVHPGSIRTELMRHLTPEIVAQMMGGSAADSEQAQAITDYKTVSQGAATSVWAGFVAAADEVGGRYCEDCSVAEPVPNESASRKGVRFYAVDPEQAEQLWTMSESMVGERF